MRDPQGIGMLLLKMTGNSIRFRRVALMTIFDQPIENVCEVEPGSAMVEERW